MSRSVLLALDGFFFALHTVLVAFNVFGWIPRKTRRLNLICLTVTAVSWFVMGLWHGIGYCILTDWHWQVRHALGIHDPDKSYVQLLIRVLTGWEAPSALIEGGCAIIFLASLTVSLALNLRDVRVALAAKRQDTDLASAGKT